MHDQGCERALVCLKPHISERNVCILVVRILRLLVSTTFFVDVHDWKGQNGENEEKFDELYKN